MGLEWLIQKRDPDQIMAYMTKQQVNILDRSLGLTHNFLTLCVVAYIVGFVFWYKKGYLDFEQARGSIATHVWGDFVAVSSGKPGVRFFQAEDLTYPGLENGNVFVATRMNVMKQKRGVCEDVEMPCHSDKECSDLVGGVCTENGFCEEPAWCDQEKKGEQYDIDAGNMLIWVKSSIQFIQLNKENNLNRIYSTEVGHTGPKFGYNMFSVRDLLLKCEPAPVRFEEIAELGAAIEVQFQWFCNVAKEDCEPVIHVKRLDTIFDPEHIGFAFKYAEYISEEERVLNRVRGVRIFFRTSGVGNIISIAATIQKTTLNSSLLALATIVAEILMLRCFQLKDKYAARKYQESPDFSEYMDDLTAKQAAMSSKPDQDSAADKEYQEREEEWMAKMDEMDS